MASLSATAGSPDGASAGGSLPSSASSHSASAAIPRPWAAETGRVAANPSRRNSSDKRSCLGSSILLTTSATGKPARRRSEARAWSTGWSPCWPSTVKSTRSAVPRATSASACTCSANPSSSAAPIPPVSTSSHGRAVARQGATRRSRVTPGWSWTMAMRRPARRLKRADLPTFGRPTIAMVGCGECIRRSATLHPIRRNVPQSTAARTDGPRASPPPVPSCQIKINKTISPHPSPLTLRGSRPAASVPHCLGRGGSEAPSYCNLFPRPACGERARVRGRLSQ